MHEAGTDKFRQKIEAGGFSYLINLISFFLERDHENKIRLYEF